MTDYLYRLELPADKRSFTVAEALEATNAALNPDSAAEGPVMILSIEKVEHPPLLRDRAGRRTALNDDDWPVLRGIWAGMADPEFPMPLKQWQPYLDAFNSSPDKPEGWSLTAMQRDPEFQTGLARVITEHEHRDLLRRAVNGRAVALRNPLTGIPSELGWVGNADLWLLTRAQMKAFCDLLAIELVDAPLLALASAGFREPYRLPDDPPSEQCKPEPGNVEAAPVSKETTPPPLTTPDIADAFDGVDGQTAKQWRDKLGDVNNHQWLIKARAQKVTAPSPATWWPIKFAELLRTRDATDESLNRAFLTAPKLKPWLPLWQEKRRDRNAFGQ